MSGARVRLSALSALAAHALLACAEDPVEPPPPAKVTSALYELADPCAGRLPLPNDVLYESDGRALRSNCALPSDPLEAALAPVERSLYAPKSPVISVPFEGSLDPASVTSGNLVLGPGSGGALPAALLFARVGTGTSADWRVLPVMASANGSTVEIRPSAELLPGGLYVAITTQSLKDQETPQKAPARAAATTALLGATPIAAGAFADLDAAAAARLETQRRAIESLLPRLPGASPPLALEKIVSVHSFTVEAGASRLASMVEAYRAGVLAGNIPFSATSHSVALSEVFVGQPASAYASVSEVHFGVLKAPRVVDQAGRLRAGWDSDGQTIDLPFSFAIPKNATSYPVVLFVPGLGRGKLDGRGIANEIANGPRAALMTIELRCHGDRSPGSDGVCVENRTAAEIAQLVDSNSNGNPELAGADGIPDASGIGYFPGDGLALRDTQLAAIIELLHVMRAVGRPGLLSGISVDTSQMHLIAQGHSAPAALAAVAYTDYDSSNLTLQLPAGGAGLDRLILGAGAAEKNAFLADLPAGLSAAQAQSYLDRLKDSALSPLDASVIGARAKSRLSTGGRLDRALLPHPSTGDLVSVDARQALIDALGLPNNRVSAHRPDCADFFIYTCNLGDSPAWRDDARRQLVTFIDSGGVTVTPPAQ